MKLSHFFIDRPIFAIVVSLFVTIVGAVAYVGLPIAQYPEIAPPTINFLEPDEKCPVDAIPNEARPMRIRTAMSNSFAFGGINAVLVVKEHEGA